MLSAIERYQSGYVEGFEDVYKELETGIYAKARKTYIQGYDTDDIVQEFSIILMNALKGYKPDKGAKFTTYFWTSINRCISRMITSADEICVSLDDEETYLELSEYDGCYGEFELLESLKQEKKLSEDDKNLLMLKIKGYTNVEASKKLSKWVSGKNCWADYRMRRIREIMS